jgi:hypothetical protein
MKIRRAVTTVPMFGLSGTLAAPKPQPAANCYDKRRQIALGGKSAGGGCCNAGVSQSNSMAFVAAGPRAKRTSPVTGAAR